MIIIPGISGSGPAHWQTLWQGPTDTRLEPASWDEPDLEDWVAALDRVWAASGDGVLVAHSLGCLAVTQWLAGAARPVTAAFLVAPPDPAAPAFPVDAPSFRAARRVPTDIPTVVVGSTNDPYASPAFVRAFAAAVGGRHVEVGPCGHINATSGLGDWPEGRALLTELVAGAGGPRA